MFWFNINVRLLCIIGSEVEIGFNQFNHLLGINNCDNCYQTIQIDRR